MFRKNEPNLCMYNELKKAKKIEKEENKKVKKGKKKQKEKVCRIKFSTHFFIIVLFKFI